jgi:serine/threonine-protein kinase
MTDSVLLGPGVTVAETYEVERLLGRGGMGEVWLARHLRLAGKQVAIKVLHTGGAVSGEALARFRREAEIAARLEHPNIVQVADFNALASGEPFLVMEYLRGESLSARLKRGPLPLDEARAVIRQVGSALEAAHRAGVVHRDLKPENIFLVPTSLGDQVKVLDFGISKLADSNTVKTSDSVLIGTPLYMSPEQAMGNNRDMTAQSDLFSLGSITYEMLSGAAPFVAESIVKVIFRIAYEPHRPLAEVVPGLPPEVNRAVEHALEKNLAARTPDVAHFVEEFTGQALISAVRPVREDVSAGLATPGMGISDSMAEGSTVAPSKVTPSPLAARATGDATPKTPSVAPTPAPVVAVAPPAAPSPSRTPLIVACVLAVGMVGGALALRSRPAPPLEQPPPPPPAHVPSVREVKEPVPLEVGASTRLQVDGLTRAEATPPGLLRVELQGQTVVVTGTAAGDAALTAWGGVDAVHYAVHVVAAPPAVVDAGPVPTPAPAVKPVSLGPIPAEEQAALAALTARARQGEWHSLWEGRQSVVAPFASKPGRVAVWSLLVEAACREHDDRVGAALNQLGEISPQERKRAVTVCRRYWAERVWE